MTTPSDVPTIPLDTPEGPVPIPQLGFGVWQVPDAEVEAAVAHLRAHGVEPELGPVPRTGGAGDGTSVYFRDPDGTLLELIAYG